MSSPGLLVSAVGHVATLTISNPGRRNSLTAEMWQQFPPLLDTLAADTTVKVVVVRGAGDDFSAGADIRDLERILHEPGTSDGGHVTAAEVALAHFPKPTIAAIDGFCVGGGWEIAGACDIRIASDRSSFGVTPSRIGIVYPLSGIERLVSIVGPAVAKLLLFSGEIIPAQEALLHGLVTRVCPAGRLMDDCAEFATLLAGRSQLSIRAMKQIVNAVAEGSPDVAPLAERWQREVVASDEPRIGAEAFLAKRAPRFTWVEPVTG